MFCIKWSPQDYSSIGVLRQLGDFSREGKLGAEGGRNRSRAVTSPTGHGQAAERWHRQLLSTVLQPAGEVTSQIHCQLRKPEQQSRNRTGTGTSTTFLRPQPKAWA